MGVCPDELRRNLLPETRERILRENWHSHDARWFLKVGMECGFDLANRLNKVTLRSMARTEMKRLMEAAGCDGAETVEDLTHLVDLACEVYFAPPMLEMEAKATGRDSLAGIVTRCLVQQEVDRAGVRGLYECACGSRHEGWLEACGLTGEVRIVKSMLRGDSRCEVSVTSIARVSDR
jgi:hypothetical protein